MIDDRAVIAPGAVLGKDVTVGPFAIIGDDVEVGDGCHVGPHTILEGPTTLGRNNRIHAFAAIGTEPQDKKYAGEPTRLEIGDDNTIREYVSINRGTSQDQGVTTIGDNNWIMAYVHIAHDCIVGSNTIMANGATLAGHVEVGDYAILGGFTKAHQFCRIGAHSFCAMDSGLSRDVPVYVTAAGHLAKPSGINSEGLKRRGFTADQIRNIRQAYKIIYRSDLKLADAIAALEEREPEQPELAPLTEFLRTTSRSIIR
ncbi:MAG: acyl-ACP--UDP-N-acetylglucosamine O-acyltransferase [Pseudomonadota bacterium]